jgi:hypothetical protein
VKQLTADNICTSFDGKQWIWIFFLSTCWE